MSGLTEDEKAQIVAASLVDQTAGQNWHRTFAAVEAVLRDRAGRIAPAPDPAGDTDWWNDTAAAVERVRALIEYHEANMNDYGLSHVVHTDELRAALDGTEETR